MIHGKMQRAERKMRINSPRKREGEGRERGFCRFKL